MHPEVAGLWLGRLEPTPRVLSMELAQAGATLQGGFHIVSDQGGAKGSLLAGSLEGRKARLIAAASGDLPVEVTGELSSDGRSFVGKWKDANGQSGSITLSRVGTGALPETGGDLSWLTTAGLLALLIAFTGAAGLGIGLCAYRRS